MVFTQNVASLSTSTAAAAIGSATGAYAIGWIALFVVGKGTSSGVDQFSAADANATLSDTGSTVTNEDDVSSS